MSTHIYSYFLPWSCWYLVANKKLHQLFISGHAQVAILLFQYLCLYLGQKKKPDTLVQHLHFSWPWWPACIFSRMLVCNCSETMMCSTFDIKLWKTIRSVTKIWLCLLFTLFYCIWSTVHYVGWVFALLGLMLFVFCFFFLWSVHTLSQLLPVILILTLFHQPSPFLFFSLVIATHDIASAACIDFPKL